MDSMLHYGTVTHALCAAMRDLLTEYETLLVQLEYQLSTCPYFTLQKFWLLIHPTLHSFSLVYAFVSDVASITHADILEEDDDEGEDDDDDDDDDTDEDDAMKEARQEMERERKQMFQVDAPEEEDGQENIQGGIVKGGEILSMLWDRAEKQSG